MVLAAGASERMGRPKALLDFRGRAFVVRILEALEALDVKSRVVVLGPDAARVRPSLATHDCVIVENPDLTSHAIGSPSWRMRRTAMGRQFGGLAAGCNSR